LLNVFDGTIMNFQVIIGILFIAIAAAINVMFIEKTSIIIFFEVVFLFAGIFIYIFQKSCLNRSGELLMFMGPFFIIYFFNDSFSSRNIFLFSIIIFCCGYYLSRKRF